MSDPLVDPKELEKLLGNGANKNHIVNNQRNDAAKEIAEPPATQYVNPNGTRPLSSDDLIDLKGIKEKLAEAEKARHDTGSDEEAAAVVVAPPDGGWGWVVVAASFVCNFLVDGIIFSFGGFLEELMNSLQVSRTEVALVGSLLSGFYLLAGPFVSALANKYGFRKVTIAGAVISSAGFVAASFSESVIQLYIFYGLFGGLGFGLIYSPSILIVGYYFERWRALATGIAVCGSGIGMLVLSPLNKMMLDSMDWRFALRVHAALVFSCISICGVLFRPLTPYQIELDPEDETPGFRPRSKSTSQAYPTAAEVLQLKKSTQSLNQNVILTRIAALKGQTNTTSVPMIPFRKRIRTTSENSSVCGHDRSRRGTVTEETEPHTGRRGTVAEYPCRSRRGTLTKMDDAPAINRPLYRDDIFYGGSLHHLADFKSSQRDFMGYTLSVTRLPTRRDVEEEAVFKLFPEAVKRALATLFDTSLLKCPSFFLLSLSGFFTLMGVFAPLTYMQERATSGGMSNTTAAWLVSGVGVTNTLGRVIVGVMSSCPCMDAQIITIVALTLGGVCTMLSNLSLSVVSQFCFTAIFGFMLACFASLRSILIVDLLGIDKLTNAFGILCLFQGLAAVIGSPIAGYIREATGSYDLSFIAAGAFLLLSGLLCAPLKAINRWEKRRSKEDETDETFVP